MRGMYYYVKFRDNEDPSLDGYLDSPGDSYAGADSRSDAYEFDTAIEALAEAERLNRDDDAYNRNGIHIILPQLKKRT